MAVRDDALGLLGLAKKAGRLALGEEPVGEACRVKNARVILLAADAAENTLRRAEQFARKGNCPCLTTDYTKDQLGWTVGRSVCAILAVTDAGMAAALVHRLEEGSPGRYTAQLEALDQKAQRTLRRRRAKREGERARELAARKPWAAPPGAPKETGK